MKQRSSISVRRATVSALGILAATSLLATASFAQQNGAAGFGGGGNGRQRGGGNYQRGGREMAVSQVPASVLATSLKLSPDQTSKIEAAQKPMMDMEKSMAAARAAGGNGGGNNGGGREMYQKMGEARTKADTDIMAVLTDSQKADLPALLKKLSALRAAGIQPGVYGDLKLSDDQETQILAIADKAQRKMRESMTQGGQQQDREAMMKMFTDMRADTKTKIEAVLTASQKQTLEEYDKAHPMMGMGGGRGGFGGGAGGGGRRGGGAPAGGGNL